MNEAEERKRQITNIWLFQPTLGSIPLPLPKCKFHPSHFYYLHTCKPSALVL